MQTNLGCNIDFVPFGLSLQGWHASFAIFHLLSQFPPSYKALYLLMSFPVSSLLMFLLIPKLVLLL